MHKRKPLWDIFSEEKKRAYLRHVAEYFARERGEEIGLLAAEDIFDTIVEVAFAGIYNKGVLDAQKLMKERSADIEADLDLLLRTN